MTEYHMKEKLTSRLFEPLFGVGAVLQKESLSIN